MSRDGHVRVLPLHVANKIAAGEVVERPASVAKELIENAIDAGAKRIAVTITQGGRKLVAVQDDGCGMTKDDAVLSLERQATSKILDVDDIERIDTLGFRGEAIPSIAAVSRFSITTRRADSDEGTFLLVNAGTLAEVRAAGCPVGTLVEVRDLFCNVPARRKFLRAYATEESHVRQIFTVHALAHPRIGFTLTVDGRELYRLAPAVSLADRVRDLFGDEFLENLSPLGPEQRTDDAPEASRDEQRTGYSTETSRDELTEIAEERSAASEVKVSGFLEKPNLSAPTRRDQYVFVNGRPASAPSIAYALREAYPRRDGETRPAAILFLELPPTQVDVNVHPTKREVRFRDNVAVKQAILRAVENALRTPTAVCANIPFSSISAAGSDTRSLPLAPYPHVTATGSATVPFSESTVSTNIGVATSTNAGAAFSTNAGAAASTNAGVAASTNAGSAFSINAGSAFSTNAGVATFTNSGSVVPANADTPAWLHAERTERATASAVSEPERQPVQVEFAVEPDSTTTKPWNWFRFLAQSASGYLLIETDAGIVTINPHAARERIAYEKLLADGGGASQTLLLPDVVKLSPVDYSRLKLALDDIRAMGFQIEEFGDDTFKIDAVPQLISGLPNSTMLASIARDLAEGGSRRSGERWRGELIAKAIARSFAGCEMKLTAEGAVKLVEELCACRMPYVCPRGKPVMIFTSTRELDRRFSR